jgi:nitroreductase
MTIRVIPVGHLDEDQVRSVLHAAMAAPSPHDRRPWRFHCTATTIELYAGIPRALPAADPDNRELVLSCGAALLNLRLAIRGLGVHPAVQLLPDPHRTNLLAVIRPQGHTVVRSVDQELADAIFRRRAGHGLFRTVPMPLAVVAGLRQAAKTERAWLSTLTAAHRSILRGLVHQDQDTQRRDSALVAELSSLRGSGAAPEATSEPLIAVVGTFHDSPLTRLQAGQAMQRVLLTATVAGLSASSLSQVVAVAATRKQVRELIVGGLWPQAVLRIGYGAPAPAAARRDLDDVVAGGQPSA